ncbi:DUF833-domain-containing protein [Rickenella mellea]|uniref:DUF833-domain-containing protein n=1 Tax=Rickenella mellea TaxID=50990 RepID=A0A4Y7QCI0_9AGAM|nr:DUF833-domain-containing protein [Rickenella mellea]
MCVAFWALEHKDYALILCANRDEYLTRRTVDARFHGSLEHAPGSTRTAPTTLSGIDLQRGGTWLGINRNGRVALITNILETWTKHKCSRGHLVSSFLSGEDDQEQFFDHLAHSTWLDYPGFNLLLFTPSSSQASSSALKYDAKLVTNLGGGGPLATRHLNPCERVVSGVSNGVDGLFGDTWCKVNKGKEILARILANTKEGVAEEVLMERLFELLSYQSPKHPTEFSQIRHNIEVTPFHLDPNLLPEADAYGSHYFGTRLSTVILVRRDGTVLFVERDIWRLGCHGHPVKAERGSERVFEFHLDRPFAS